MSQPRVYGNHRRHLVFVICGEPHLVVGDIPGLDAADHAAPGGVAEIGHGGCLLGPGIPNDAGRGADLLDDDAAAPPAIFDDASPRRIEVDAVGLFRLGRMTAVAATGPPLPPTYCQASGALGYSLAWI
jgi:hypothetical protein